MDNLGGDVLAWMAQHHAGRGLAREHRPGASPTFNTTVMPFILRGVSLLGIDSGDSAMPLREAVGHGSAATSSRRC